MRSPASSVTTPSSRSASRLLGYVVDAQQARVSAALLDATLNPGTTTFEATLHHRDGVRTVPLELSAVNLLDDPVVEGLVVTAYDITPLREAQDSLQYLASHDPLTDLANRTLLVERLDEALARAPEQGPVTVFFIDLDRFKPVNDLLGHEAGDRLLVEVAVRLRNLARGDDTVARLGGDEFVVVAEEVDTLDTVQSIARRIEEGLERAGRARCRPDPGLRERGLCPLRRAFELGVVARRRRRGHVPGEGRAAWRHPSDGRARERTCAPWPRA